MKRCCKVWDVSPWVCAFACVPTLLMADITTDGSLGDKRQLAGPNFAIPSTLGQISGSNLFHSFDVFNIRQGETASFSGPGNISNVISRVTGGTSSSIDGLLRSTMPQADLWIINPSGIAFGPNAQLDVKGSFHASTGQSVKFQDGTEFKADTRAQPVLTTAAPVAFGFLQSNAAPLTVHGSQLGVSGLHGMTLAGGVVRIDGGASLSGAQIKVASQGSPGQVAVGPVVEVGAGTQQGDTVINDSKLSAGVISIRGGRLQTANASLTTSGTSLVNLIAHQDVDLGAGTVASANGARGGTIRVQSEQGTTTVAGALDAKGSNGPGGKVDILGPHIKLTNQASVDVTGRNGGGNVRIGGGLHGDNGQLPNALTTDIEAGATIRADAGEKNNGGKVVVWSDDRTRFSGTISALGGEAGGAGGFAEVSGKNSLKYEGRTDLRAAKGEKGALLLEASDVLIFDDTSSSPTMSFTDLRNQLQKSDVEISALGHGAVEGNIRFGGFSDNDFDYNGVGKAGLTLRANNDIRLGVGIFDSDIKNDLLNLTLIADSDRSGAGKPALHGGKVDVPRSFSAGGLNINGILTITGDEANISRSIITRATGAPSGIVFRDLDKVTIGTSISDGIYNPIFVETNSAGAFSSEGILFQNISDLVVGVFDTESPDNFNSLTPNSNPLPVGQPVEVRTSTSGAGSGGDIQFINIGQLAIKSGAALKPSVNNSNPDREQVTTKIATTTLGSGDAGNLQFLNVGKLRIEGGEISSVSSAAGPTGSISFRNVSELALKKQTESGSVVIGSGSGTENKRLDIDVGANIKTERTETASGRVKPVNFTNVGQLMVDRGVISSSGNIGFDRISHLIVKGGDDSGAITTETQSAANAGALSFKHIGVVDLVSGGTIASNSTNHNGFGSVAELGDAGNITFADIGALTVGSNSQIRSRTQGGIGDAGTITFNDIGRLSIFGTVSTSSTSLATSAQAGNIVMNGIGVLDVNGGQINSRTLGNGPAGTINLRRINSVTVHNRGVIRSDTTGPGNAGQISIATTRAGKNTFASDSVNARAALTADIFRLNPPDTLVVRDHGSISSKSALSPETPDVFSFRADPSKLGAPGSIKISAGEVDVKDSGSISVVTDSRQVTDASQIAIVADRMSVADAEISAATTGRTDAGQIALRITRLKVGAGGKISGSSTGTDSNAGKAGSITVTGRNSSEADRVIFDKGSLLTTAREGQGGRIAVQSHNITVSRKAIVSAEVSGQLAQGKRGQGADISMRSSGSILVDKASISASTSGTRTGGSVTLEAPAVTIRDKGTVKVSTRGTGHAGAVNVFSSELLLETPGAINSSTSSAGDAGAVNISTRSLTLRNGAEILSTSTGTRNDAGNAGSIAIRGLGSERATDVNIIASSLLTTARKGGGGTIRLAADRLLLDQAQLSAAVADSNGIRPATNPDVTLNGDQLLLQGGSRVLATTSGSRAGGNVNLSGTDVSLSGGASVRADSTGTGTAGTINVVATNRFQSDGSTVSTQSTSADGGNINFSVAFLMQLQDSRITTSVAGGTGKGGNITIDPVFLVLNNSAIEANAFGGPGGNINIAADFFFRPDDSRVSASSQLSTPGTVVGNTPDRSLSGNLSALPSNFLNAASLLRERCGQRANVGQSTFTVTGRGGLPATPSEPISLPVEMPEAESTAAEQVTSSAVAEPAVAGSPCTHVTWPGKNMQIQERYN